MESRGAKKKLNYLVDVVSGQFKSAGGCTDLHVTDDDFGKDYEPRYTEEELPAAVDMRPCVSPVEDQAMANSCTANAVVDGYEYLMRRMDATIDFCRLFVYYNALAEALAEAIEAWKAFMETWRKKKMATIAVMMMKKTKKRLRMKVPRLPALKSIRRYSICLKKRKKKEG